MFFLLGAEVGGEQVAGGVGAGVLGEVDEVNGRAALFVEFGDFFLELGGRVFELERDRTLVGLDEGGGRAGERGELFGEKRGVAEGGGHEEEAGARQRQQRDLPGYAARVVGVVVELVHDDIVHRGVRAVAEGDVGKDFGGAADDRGIVVDGGVAGDHADVFRAEHVAEREEFLVGKRLDRDGVVRAAALAEGFELEGEGDERFSGAGGCVEYDVVAGEEFEDGFFLVVVGLGVGGGEVVEEDVEDVVRRGVFGEILAAERGGHAREGGGGLRL